jgi:hypothetical protein
MTKTWTDEALFREFDLTSEEIDFISSIVREMPQQG